MKIALYLAMLVLLPGCVSRTLAPVTERAAAPRAPVVTAQPAPPVLVSPSGGLVPGPAVASPTVAPPTYVVRQGDTLVRIASAHRVGVRELAAWNNLENPNALRIGQVLVLGPPPMIADAPVSTQAADPVEPSTGVVTSVVLPPPAIIEGSIAPRAPGAIAVPGGQAGAPVSPGRAGGEAIKTEPRAVRVPYSELAVAQLQSDPAVTAGVLPPRAAPATPPSGGDSRPASTPAVVAPVTTMKPAPAQTVTPAPAPSTTPPPIQTAPPAPVVAAPAARPAPAVNAVPVPRPAPPVVAAPAATAEPPVRPPPAAVAEPAVRAAPALTAEPAARPAPSATAEPAPRVAPAAPAEPAPRVANAAPTMPAVPSKPLVAEEDSVEWTWPAAGRVISGFSDGNGSKGIDIAGTMGQAVLASAAGRVVYVGSGLRGYGKLIIVKHNKTYLSAYAHNSQILVREGQEVARGQKIAEMGNTDADQVKLHFEIRRMGKPVDPFRYLPRA